LTWRSARLGTLLRHGRRGKMLLAGTAWAALTCRVGQRTTAKLTWL